MMTRPKPRGLGLASGGDESFCRDCGREPEFYMVYDDIWRAAGMTSAWGNLCLTDLASRLARPLAAEDFYFGAPIDQEGGERNE